MFRLSLRRLAADGFPQFMQADTQVDAAPDACGYLWIEGLAAVRHYATALGLIARNAAPIRIKPAKGSAAPGRNSSESQGERPLRRKIRASG